MYIGLGWQWIAQANPDFEETNQPLEPFNDFLRFFLCSFIMLCIAGAQYIIRFIRSMIDPSPSLAFSDFCTLANCSIIILPEYFNGYYIHGKAPWKKSDIPISWLKAELDWESEAKYASRNIGSSVKEKNDNEIRLNEGASTSEIYITPAFREKIWDLTDRFQDKIKKSVDEANKEQAENAAESGKDGK